MFSVEMIKGVSPKNIEKFSKNSVTFGRGEEVDYEFSSMETTVSRGVHFAITKTPDEDCEDGFEYRVNNLKDNVLIVQFGNKKQVELEKGSSCLLDVDTAVQVGHDGPILRILLEQGNDKTVSVRAAEHRHTSIHESEVKASYNARKWWTPTAIAVAVMAILGLWFNGLQDSRNKEVLNETKETVFAQRDNIQDLSKRAESIEDELRNALISNDQTSVKLAEITSKVNDISASNIKLNFVEEYGSSIYALGVMSPDGKFQLGGTGWKVGSNLVMTNAHVAEGLFELHASHKGTRIVALLPSQQAGARGETYEVDSDFRQMHLGYKTYGAFSFPIVTLVEDNIGQFGELDWHNSTDCAILTCINELPGEIIEIASMDEIQDLKIGEPISTLGFPGVAAGETDNPSLITDHGVIASLEDAFGRSTSPKFQTKMGITTNIAGGASGSPIFNKTGKAIGIVTSTYHDGRNKFQFAERADFMIDLMKRDYGNAFNDWEKYVWEIRNERSNSHELAKVLIGSVAEVIPEATYTNDCIVAVNQYVFDDRVTINKSDPNEITIFENLNMDGYCAVVIIPEEGFDIDFSLESIRRELRRKDGRVDKSAFRKNMFSHNFVLQDVRKQKDLPVVHGFFAPDNKLTVKNPWKNLSTYWVTRAQERASSTTLRVVCFQFSQLKSGCYLNE